jgi:hypothetical protein
VTLRNLVASQWSSLLVNKKESASCRSPHAHLGRRVPIVTLHMEMSQKGIAPPLLLLVVQWDGRGERKQRLLAWGLEEDNLTRTERSPEKSVGLLAVAWDEESHWPC